MNRKRKIYVASSWRNQFYDVMILKLKKMGHDVYDFRHPFPGNDGFSWNEIDKDWINWTPLEYKEALDHPSAKQGFKNDFDAMRWADTCLMLLPCGRSANTEAGWMKGARKDVFVYQVTKEEPELMYKIYDEVLTSVDDFNRIFKF